CCAVISSVSGFFFSAPHPPRCFPLSLLPLSLFQSASLHPSLLFLPLSYLSSPLLFPSIHPLHSLPFLPFSTPTSSLPPLSLYLCLYYNIGYKLSLSLSLSLSL